METNTLTITNTRCLTNLLCEVVEFFTYLNEFLFYFLNGKLTHLCMVCWIRCHSNIIDNSSRGFLSDKLDDKK